MQNAFIYDNSGKLQVISIAQARELTGGKGGKGGYFCQKCDGVLSARFSRGRAHHFMHQPCCPCEGEPATDMHNRVRDLIMNASVSGKGIKLPNGEVWIASHAVSEMPHEGFQPDVTIWVDGKKRFIEVTFTHPTPEKKKAILFRYGVPTLEIDIKRLYGKEVSEDDLRDLVLNQVKGKLWIVPPGASSPARIWRRKLGQWMHFLMTMIREWTTRKPSFGPQLELKLVGGSSVDGPRRARLRSSRRNGRFIQPRLV